MFGANLCRNFQWAFRAIGCLSQKKKLCTFGINGWLKCQENDQTSRKGGKINQLVKRFQKLFSLRFKDVTKIVQRPKKGQWNISVLKRIWCIGVEDEVGTPLNPNHGTTLAWEGIWHSGWGFSILILMQLPMVLNLGATDLSMHLALWMDFFQPGVEWVEGASRVEPQHSWLNSDVGVKKGQKIQLKYCNNLRYSAQLLLR